ncbi:hypothetical protein GGR56DRAFT_680366 [Xylariaceae sp. FL0804]|nr:hypothetical protein GGR56DRAFT_680366 [Xylariaceae sp. FL0804]
MSTPNYGGSPDTVPVNIAMTAASVGDSNGLPGYDVKTSAKSAKSTPAEAVGAVRTTVPVTVAVQPGVVVINGQTFSSNPAQGASTATVTVGDAPFVINPTEVVGAGVTVNRPTAGGAVYTDSPATTTVAGVQVIYGSSIATIDGTVFTLEPTPNTVVVGGQRVVLDSEGIAFPSQTISAWSNPGPTGVTVLGGAQITAIGSDKFVVDGTTITYGPASPTMTDVIDGDTLLIGPSGVVVHGKTLGGAAAAAPTATTYEQVGGVTVTQAGPSAVVIDGTTYHIGAGATTATPVVGGEAVTVGPDGVAVSTFTLDAPDHASTTTIMVAGTGGEEATAAPKAHKAHNGGARARPDRGGTGVTTLNMHP